MTITKNKVVLFDYILTDDAGTVIDASKDHGPLGYIQGSGQIIPGLEKEMDGKKSGDKFKVSITADMAYGDIDESLVQKVPKSEFEGIEGLAVGAQFQVQTDNGPLIVTVIEVADDSVILDGNHPLAGKSLHFDVSIVSVRDASAEELSHGHVHGEGGHQH